MVKHLQADDELIKRISENDRDAYSALYTKHLSNLYRYIYLICKSKEVSEEIVQEVFLKIWENRGSLTNVNSFKGFLYKCAKNLLLDYIRKQQSEAKLYNQFSLVSEENQLSSDHKLIYNQYYTMIQQAINSLPQKRKKIVEMRTQEDLSLDEIADRLAISKSVVKKQLYLGMGFVRNYMHSQVDFILVFAAYLLVR